MKPEFNDLWIEERSYLTRYLDDNIMVTLTPLMYTPHNDVYFFTFYPGDRYRTNRAFIINHYDFKDEEEFKELLRIHKERGIR